jgi:hypothetical protein
VGAQGPARRGAGGVERKKRGDEMAGRKKGPDTSKVRKHLSSIISDSELLPASSMFSKNIFIRNGQAVEVGAQARKEIASLCEYLGGLPLVRVHHVPKYIQAEVQSAVLSILGGNSANDEAKELINRVTASADNFIAVVPIDGLDFKEGRSLKIGKMTIEKFNKNRAKLFSNDNQKVIETQNRRDTILERGPKGVKFISQWGSVNGVVRFTASEASAAERAINIAERELNALRLFVGFLGRNWDQCKFGIRGRMPIILDSVDIYNESKDTLTSSSSRKGHLFNQTFNGQNLSKLRSNAKFVKVRKIMRQEEYNLTDFESRLEKSISWLGRSFLEIEPTNTFIFCAIALETIFSQGRTNLIEHISLCASKAVSAKKIPQREKLYSIIKNLYNLRGEIVHTGKDYVSKNDAQVLSTVTLYSLLYALSQYGSVTSESDWSTHLRRLKLR